MEKFGGGRREAAGADLSAVRRDGRHDAARGVQKSAPPAVLARRGVFMGTARRGGGRARGDQRAMHGRVRRLFGFRRSGSGAQKKPPAEVGRGRLGATFCELPRLLQQAEGRLRGRVGLRQHGGGGLRQDLRPRQVRGLRGEVGIGDRAFGGRGVLVRDAQAVDRRADRELLERAEPAAELADLLDRRVEICCAVVRFLAGEEFVPPLASELRYPVVASPRLPVETDCDADARPCRSR